MKIFVVILIALISIIIAHTTAWVIINLYYRSKVNKYQLGIYRTSKRKFNDSMLYWFEIWLGALLVFLIVAYLYDHFVG